MRRLERRHVVRRVSCALGLAKALGDVAAAGLEPIIHSVRGAVPVVSTRGVVLAARGATVAVLVAASEPSRLLSR
jgi:hypothetical protein